MKTVIMLLILVALCDGYETITGHTGENVTLTFPNCSSNPLSSVRVQKIGSEKHIYSCIDGHPIIPEHQDPSFVGRVEGMKCPMRGGAIYVNVTGLTTNDSGLYEWFSTTSGGTKFTFYLKVTDRGAADGDDVRGKPTSGNPTSGNPTSGNPTSRNPTSGTPTSGNPTSENSTSENSTSGNSWLVVVGGILAAAAGIIIIIVVYMYRDRLKSWMMRCRNRNQQNSEPPVTYREVNQQQV